jgi:hypothetical protein
LFLMEPNYFWANLFFVAAPFVAYFLGIIIRGVAMPRRREILLRHQCLLGIPVSLVVVSPFLPVLNATTSNLPGFLVTIGVIIEHGMLVNETATYHLNQLISSYKGALLPERPRENKHARPHSRHVG